AAARKFA
nr:Chain O, JARID2-substrate [Homo sapiens]6C24_O Chain O, JARID2-substrate [Homo sapiens]